LVLLIGYLFIFRKGIEPNIMLYLDKSYFNNRIHF